MPFFAWKSGLSRNVCTSRGLPPSARKSLCCKALAIMPQAFSGRDLPWAGSAIRLFVVGQAEVSAGRFAVWRLGCSGVSNRSRGSDAIPPVSLPWAIVLRPVEGLTIPSDGS